MNKPPRIEPTDVILKVEQYVDKEIHDAGEYSNRELLDQSGVWSLHALAAEIYALGFDDGERAEGERSRRQRGRERDAEKHTEGES